jgi:hypothetical protein
MRMTASRTVSVAALGHEPSPLYDRDDQRGEQEGE